MHDIDSTLSEKAKQYLERKLLSSQEKIKKLKRKRRIIKIIYYTSVISSVSISTIIASLTSITGIPPLTITILSSASGILTGLSAKFNLQSKKDDINKAIEKLHKIEIKLEQVIQCNGNFTKEDYQQLLTEY